MINFFIINNQEMVLQEIKKNNYKILIKFLVINNKKIYNRQEREEGIINGQERR